MAASTSGMHILERPLPTEGRPTHGPEAGRQLGAFIPVIPPHVTWTEERLFVIEFTIDRLETRKVAVGSRRMSGTFSQVPS